MAAWISNDYEADTVFIWKIDFFIIFLEINGHLCDFIADDHNDCVQTKLPQCLDTVFFDYYQYFGDNGAIVYCWDGPFDFDAFKTWYQGG